MKSNFAYKSSNILPTASFNNFDIIRCFDLNSSFNGFD